METKTNKVLESKQANKSTIFMEMVTSFAKEACNIIRTSESFFAINSAKEVVAHYRKCESADCEYTLYVNTNAAEIWLQKAIEFNKR